MRWLRKYNSQAFIWLLTNHEAMELGGLADPRNSPSDYLPGIGNGGLEGVGAANEQCLNGGKHLRKMAGDEEANCRQKTNRKAADHREPLAVVTEGWEPGNGGSHKRNPHSGKDHDSRAPVHRRQRNGPALRYINPGIELGRH